MRVTICIVLLALWSFSAAAQNGGGAAGQTPEFLKLQKSFDNPREGWKPLFNGKDLSNWKPLVRAQAKVQRPNDWAAPVSVEMDPQDPTRLQRSPYRPGNGPPAFVN